jgi:hypothetical protein
MVSLRIENEIGCWRVLTVTRVTQRKIPKMMTIQPPLKRMMSEILRFTSRRAFQMIWKETLVSQCLFVDKNVHTGIGMAMR